MKTYEWNEIGCEITEWTEKMKVDEAAYNKEWGDGFPLKAEHEWFREYRSDRNHLSLMGEYENAEAAHAAFMNSEEYAICMADEEE